MVDVFACTGTLSPSEKGGLKEAVRWSTALPITRRNA